MAGGRPAGTLQPRQAGIGRYSLDLGRLAAPRDGVVQHLLDEVRAQADVLDRLHSGDVLDMVHQPVDRVIARMQISAEEVDTDHPARRGDAPELAVRKDAVVLEERRALEWAASTGRDASSHTCSTPATPR
nr:hypothetical protein [Streptomyces aureus]